MLLCAIPIWRSLKRVPCAILKRAAIYLCLQPAHHILIQPAKLFLEIHELAVLGIKILESNLVLNCTLFACGLAIAKPQGLTVTRCWKDFLPLLPLCQTAARYRSCLVVMTTVGLRLISLRQWRFFNGSPRQAPITWSRLVTRYKLAHATTAAVKCRPSAYSSIGYWSHNKNCFINRRLRRGLHSLQLQCKRQTGSDIFGCTLARIQRGRLGGDASTPPHTHTTTTTTTAASCPLENKRWSNTLTEPSTNAPSLVVSSWPHDSFNN